MSLPVRCCVKWPKFLIPTLQHQMKQAGGDESKLHLHHSALIVAAWLRYLDGMDEKGNAIQIVDSTAEQLGLLKLAAENQAMNKGKNVTAARLMEAAGDVVFGDVWRHQGFVSEVQQALDSLYEVGARATMQRWLENSDSRDSVKAA